MDFKKRAKGTVVVVVVVGALVRLEADEMRLTESL
jgi:hypothetical protein